MKLIFNVGFLTYLHVYANWRNKLELYVGDTTMESMAIHLWDLLKGRDKNFYIEDVNTLTEHSSLYKKGRVG
jgi:hypothetical protein